MFRSSRLRNNVRQVRGADGRTRDVGTRDYVEQGLTLRNIRREDLQNQMAQAQAQLDQLRATHQSDQDFQRAKVLYSTQSLTKARLRSVSGSLQCNTRCDGQRKGRAL